MTEPEPFYFCGRVETLTDDFTTKPWPVKRLPYHLDATGFRGSLDEPQLKMAFEEAFNSWATYLDLEPVAVDRAGDALIQSVFGRIDGYGRVLAYSELADGTARVKGQTYDSGDSWVVSDEPVQNYFDLLRVMIHELGHMLGLTHDKAGADAIMAPTYSWEMPRPTARDVNRLLALGYQPRPIIVAVAPTPVEKLLSTIKVYSTGRVDIIKGE